MRGGILHKPSFTARPQEPSRERAEPRLVPPDVLRPLRRSPIADPGVLSAPRDSEPTPLKSPAISPADRLPIAAARHPAGLLPYFALAGFATLAIGIVAGIWFLQPEAPAKNTVIVSGQAAAELPRANRAPGPISPEASRSAVIATSATPSVPGTKPPTANYAAPKPQANAGQAAPPASLDNKPPALAAPLPGHGAGSPVAATNIAAPPPAHAKAKDSTGDHHTMSPATGYHRPVHARAEPRHARLRTARNDRSPAPLSPSAQTATPRESDQAASFDRLMTQLTEPNKPAGQSLTPPAAGAVDPFAQPASGK
jgi:hypothetical protein